MNDFNWGNLAAQCVVMGFVGAVLRYYVKSEIDKMKETIEGAFEKKLKPISDFLTEWTALKPNLVTDEKCVKTMAECPAHKTAEKVMMSALEKTAS